METTASDPDFLHALQYKQLYYNLENIKYQMRWHFVFLQNLSTVICTYIEHEELTQITQKILNILNKDEEFIDEPLIDVIGALLQRSDSEVEISGRANRADSEHIAAFVAALDVIQQRIPPLQEEINALHKYTSDVPTQFAYLLLSAQNHLTQLPIEIASIHQLFIPRMYTEPVE